MRLSGKPAVVGGRGLLRRDAGAGAGRAPPEANGFARSMVSLFLIVFIGGRALLNSAAFGAARAQSTASAVAS